MPDVMRILSRESRSDEDDVKLGNADTETARRTSVSCASLLTTEMEGTFVFGQPTRAAALLA